MTGASWPESASDRSGEMPRCKVCQVENNCPIKVAKLVDGKITIDDSAWQSLRPLHRKNVRSMQLKTTLQDTASTSADAGARRWHRDDIWTRYLLIRKKCSLSSRRRSFCSANRGSQASVLPIRLQGSGLRMFRNSCLQMIFSQEKKKISRHRNILSAGRPARRLSVRDLVLLKAFV